MNGALGCLSSQQISTTTYKDQAYQVIKEAILYRRLKVGEIYSQDNICNQLNISRTPVREALLELSKEGYVSFLRGKGIMVTPIESKEATDIVELRKILEIAGCRLAAERATQEQMDEIKKHLCSMEYGITQNDGPEELYKVDRRFHRSIFLAAGNTWLLDTVEKCRDHYLRVESQTAFNTREMCQEVLKEHYEIYHAICARNEDEAVRAMTIHLDRTCERTLYLSENKR